MNEHVADPPADDLRHALARALYEHDGRGTADRPDWDGPALDSEHPGLRECYLQRAEALADGPLATLLIGRDDRIARDEELRVLRRQRMAPERERELLEANNRILARAHAAEAAHEAAEAALAVARRERDVAREAETFWQHFAFDADELATRRLIEQTDARTEAERSAIRERCRRERAEAALRLFADRAEVMPKAGWASELTKANRDIPLWWFHAARAALGLQEPESKAETDQP